MANLPLDKLEDVLRKLSEDDDFRDRFQNDPAAELRKHGIDVDPSSLPADSTLPSKEEIRATFDERMEKTRAGTAEMAPLPIWMGG